MRKKSQTVLICVTLVLSILLSGCGKQPQASSAPTWPPRDMASSVIAAPENAVSSTAEEAAESIEREYEYVRAVLKDNKLQVTILSNESSSMLSDSWGKIQYDVPYDVLDLTGTYTNMYIGTIGQDIWLYVFLLTREGAVECVPIADPLFETERANPSADVSFRSIGVLPGIANVVLFKHGSVSLKDGSEYVTVFAECGDGSSYDLMFPLTFIQYPEDAPASEEDSLQILKENADVAQLLSQGKKAWSTGDFTFLYCEYGRVFSMGANRMEQLSRKWSYAVGASGAVYSLDNSHETWVPANPLAELYYASDNYSDLFAVITDPSEPLYQQYKDTAELINTPVVAVENSDPVLIMPLKTQMNLKVEMMAGTTSDTYATVADSFFDGTVSLRTPYLISVSLSETTSVLRVTATWYDGFSDMVAVWYATYYEGSPLYLQYVSGNYSYPSEG